MYNENNIYSEWKDKDNSKRKNIILTVTLSVLLIIVIFLGISFPKKDKYKITIKNKEITIERGNYYQIESNDKNLKYNMLDLNIARVNDEGNIIGLKEGSTNLVITSNNSNDYKIVKIVVIKNEEEIKEKVELEKEDNNQEEKKETQEEKVEQKQEIKIESKKEEKVESKQETKIEKKEEVKTEKKVETNNNKKQENKSEPKQEVKVEIKKEEKVEQIQPSIKKQEVKQENKKVNISWSNGIENNVASGGASRVYMLPNGILVGGAERDGKIFTVVSSDNGNTWSTPKIAASIDGKNLANINFFYNAGNLYMAYRATSGCDSSSIKCNTSLNVSVSHDSGNSWQYHSKIIENTMSSKKENRGYWEPYLGLINGKLTVLYSNDIKSSSWQNIELLTWNGSSWTNNAIISNGKVHKSRDGMPSWIKLSNGTYALVIESSKYRNNNYPFVLQLLYSKDGINWSNPKDIYIPSSKGSKAAAPGIAELSNGQIVISFQTDEDSNKKGDNYSICKTIYSDGTNIELLTNNNFSKPEKVFNNTTGMWPSIHYSKNYLYVAGGSNFKKLNIK